MLHQDTGSRAQALEKKTQHRLDVQALDNELRTVETPFALEGFGML